VYSEYFSIIWFKYLWGLQGKKETRAKEVARGAIPEGVAPLKFSKQRKNESHIHVIDWGQKIFVSLISG
jgi:hypothetical protein